jgi:hypothetical protein
MHDGRNARTWVHFSVEDAGDGQAAGAAALDRQPAAGRVLLGHQVVGAGDEVGEGVALGQQLAAVVPVLAQFAAAADMGQGVDHAAVQQAQPI